MARIGQILVSLGATTDNNVARALGVQGFAGGRLGTLLLERGSVTEDDLGEALGQQHSRPYVSWAVLGEVPPDVVAALPAKFAIRHSAIPFERGEGYLKIALRDPNDLRILDELFFVTGRKILPVVAPEVRIYHALEKYYGERRTPRYAILGEKLTRPAKRRTKSSGPPPPPDFFPPGRSPKPPPKPDEVWGDAADADVADTTPIIQKWSVPDESPKPWSLAKAPAEAPEEAISWEETPPPGMWLPEGPTAGKPAAAPAGGRRTPTPTPTPVSVVPEIFVAAPETSAAAASPPPEPVPDKPMAPALTPPPLPSEHDFPEILAARGRDAIAAAALAGLSRRFGRGGFFVARPNEVAGHSATGPGIDREAFKKIRIPWSEPSIFLNVRLSRSFYLGALPPLPRHRTLVESLGGSPEECLVQPVVMKDKPVAFLFAEFGRDQGATPMDLAYMRGLAAAAARAFAAAIRQKKKEPV